MSKTLGEIQTQYVRFLSRGDLIKLSKLNRIQKRKWWKDNKKRLLSTLSKERR
jgi:hypothetical protein